MKTLLLIFFLLFTVQQTHISKDEQIIVNLINNYRKEHNLPKLNVNLKLVNTARTHIYQLKNIKPFEIPNFSIHSWYNCNYDEDKECMWRKPKELFNYNSTGYEIITYNTVHMTPERALNNFQNSEPHNDIILNKKVWETVEFKSIGIAINNNYCSIWFGEI